MVTRAGLIAVLVVVEIGLIGEMVLAVRGDAGWPGPPNGAQASSDAKLVEGGAHKIFDAGSHPALNIDIGYADLTIRAGEASQFDVSVSKPTDFGIFRATSAITARKDGDTIRIAVAGGRGFSTGDMRMVTVVVPPETQVNVADAGDIRMSGLHGETSVKSVGDGSVTVEDFDASELHVTADGRITLNRIASPRLEISAGDDGVVGTALQVRDGSIESDGRVTLGFPATADTVVNAEASDGKVRVTGFAGSTTAQTPPKDSDSDSSSQSVRIGAGEGLLDVHSSDGNISISQEG